MNFNVFYSKVLNRTSRLAKCGALGLVMLSVAGCASMGHKFPAGQVQSIRIGETTQNDIYTTFGTPWRTGIENGLKTWTYGDYQYNLFTESETEDLIIKFDKRGVVSSFTYNSSKRSK